IAEAQHGARVALLFPELCDLLLELLVLGLERGVKSLGQRAHDLDPAIRQDVDLLLDLVQRSHTPPNAGRETAIPGVSPVSELLEAVLVDAEIVGQFVQNGDPDLLPQLILVGEAPHERPPEDRDLVRHVVLGFPEAVELRIGGAFLLDHARDDLEAAGQFGRQLGEGRLDDLVEAHQRGRRGTRPWKSRTASIPSTNPPTCAANATPPPPSGCVSEKPPCQSWKTNHTPRKIIADSGTGRKPKSSVTTRAWGRSTK